MKHLKMACTVVLDIKGRVSVARAAGCSVCEEAISHLVPSLHAGAETSLRDLQPMGNSHHSRASEELQPMGHPHWSRGAVRSKEQQRKTRREE